MLESWLGLYPCPVWFEKPSLGRFGHFVGLGNHRLGDIRHLEILKDYCPVAGSVSYLGQYCHLPSVFDYPPQQIILTFLPPGVKYMPRGKRGLKKSPPDFSLKNSSPRQNLETPSSFILEI